MSSSNLHEFVLQTLSESFDDTTRAWSTAEKLKFIFKNYRVKNTTHCGLRLTYIGDRLMSKHFSSYSYETEKRISNSALLGLDKNMIWPYYIGKQHVTFYSTDDAAWFQLNGHDINTFTDFI